MNWREWWKTEADRLTDALSLAVVLGGVGLFVIVWLYGCAQLWCALIRWCK